MLTAVKEYNCEIHLTFQELTEFQSVGTANSKKQTQNKNKKTIRKVLLNV